MTPSQQKINHFDLHLQERILLDSMFEVPGSNICDVVIEEDCVKAGKTPRYLYRADSTSRSDFETCEEGISLSAQNP